MDYIQQSVVLIKPDGVKRALIGDVISRFERAGLKIIALKMMHIDADHARKHYPVGRKEWVENIGKRALQTYEEYGQDPNEDLDNLDPMVIGTKMADWLVDFLTEGPLLAMIVEGEGAIPVIRKMVGHTFGEKAVPGTIRGDYTTEMGYTAFSKKQAGRNLIHASGNKEEAEFEKKLWFKENEIFAYKRAGEDL